MPRTLSAIYLSPVARRATYALGMKTVREFEILDARSVDYIYEHDDPETPVLKLSNKKRSIILTAGDLIEASRNLDYNPMARVVRS